MLMMRYSVSPAEFYQNMSMVDLQLFIDGLQEKIMEENKQIEKENRSNKLMKGLIAIRDILNFMFPPDGKRR